MAGVLKVKLFKGLGGGGGSNQKLLELWEKCIKCSYFLEEHSHLILINLKLLL